jgi:hypothetical protein
VEKRRSRIIGVLFFFSLVGAIQLGEHLFLWYQHRDERVHLTQLREELVDRGAAMIEAQLEVERLRDRVDTLDGRTGPAGPISSASPDRIPAGALSPAARVTLERNQRLDELREAVNRRNSAAVDYHLLADSIRSVADRARDPYFAIPLPAEAATARGIAPNLRPSGVVRPERIAPGIAQSSFGGVALPSP